MSTPADDSSLFERLKTGLEEGIRFARGELTLRTTELPERPPELQAQDVLRLRQKLKMSQGVFARLLNVSAKTVQSWEQGDRKPSQAALRLLQIMEARPKLVCRIIGIRPGRRAL
jgi:putative transcriptional regulator